MITRRSLLKSAAGSIAAPYLLLGQKSREPRKNVLFIASDDLNTNLGCYGHPIVKSPHLDRLAAMGTRFDRAYCQYPLCGPSRTSLLSGRRPDSTKIWENQIAVRDTMPEIVTLPQLFRNHGAHAARYGKMYHMDVPGSVGTNKWDDPQSWDVAVSPPGLEDKSPGERGITTPKQPRGSTGLWISIPSSEVRTQADELAAEHSVELIHKSAGKPFFLATGFLRPHVPYVAPSKFFDLYPLSQMKPVENPANDLDDIPKASEIAINTRARDIGGMSDQNKREALRAYYASISYMDSLVGRLLDALEKSKQLDSTMIVFWSDHGYHLGEHYRWHKRSLFEESARVSLIAASPGQRVKGKGSRALVELVDMYPSIAESCGLTPPPGLEGQSFMPLLDNPARPWKSAAFTQVSAPNGIVGRSIRTDRYRYVRWEGPYPDEELYDESGDPREFTNLARFPDKHKATLDQLRGVLDRGWRAAMAKV
jgi:uncharacterized sulfatase